MKTMGEKLRDLRNVTGLSQRAFGEKIGVARGSLNGYENSPNPIPRGVIWKICQATNIGVEYFETDMDLAQAFAKYKLNPHRLEVKDMQECICSLYDGIENFIEQKTCKDPLNTKAYLFNFLFNDIGNFDLNFVKVKGNELAPYARNNEILALIKEKNPKNLKNGDKIIIEFGKNIYAVQYFKMQEIMLFATFSEATMRDYVYQSHTVFVNSPNSKDDLNQNIQTQLFSFKDDEDFVKSVKILAIIKGKYAFEL